MDPKDVQGLFKSLDFDGSGTISYNEFVRTVKGPLNQFRTDIVLKAFKQLDRTGDGLLTIDDIKGAYSAACHPDVKSGKRTEDEVLSEFLETFETHHSVMNGAKSDSTVTPEEFLEYYANISMNIDSDAYFELMMANSYNLAGSSQAYAGSKAKVTQVNAREAYRQDHHRNLFGTDKRTPFGKKQQTDWATTNGSNFREGGLNEMIPSAGGGSAARSGVSNDPKMQFMQQSERMTPAQYRGIQHSDDELTEMFRQKLASRGARGILGM